MIAKLKSTLIDPFYCCLQNQPRVRFYNSFYPSSFFFIAYYYDLWLQCVKWSSGKTVIKTVPRRTFRTNTDYIHFPGNNLHYVNIENLERRKLPARKKFPFVCTTNVLSFDSLLMTSFFINLIKFWTGFLLKNKEIIWYAGTYLASGGRFIERSHDDVVGGTAIRVDQNNFTGVDTVHGD